MEDVVLAVFLVVVIIALIIIGRMVEKSTGKQRKRKRVLRLLEKVSCCG